MAMAAAIPVNNHTPMQAMRSALCELAFEWMPMQMTIRQKATKNIGTLVFIQSIALPLGYPSTNTPPILCGSSSSAP